MYSLVGALNGRSKNSPHMRFLLSCAKVILSCEQAPVNSEYTLEFTKHSAEEIQAF